MHFLRRVLAVLLVFSLAATPVAARVAATTTTPATANMVMKASLPDCHGMKMTVDGHKTPDQKHCPDCDKSKSCLADLCQFKCFEILAALSSPPRIGAMAADRYGSVQHRAPKPIILNPQPPPPRA